MSDPTALIAAWARSAVAPHGGAFNALQPQDIAAPVLRALLARSGISPQAVDAVVLGNALGAGGNPARMLALAAGLNAVAERDAYRKLLVSRPIFPFGRDIGFLPGDVEAKLSPWMQPIHDNIDFLTSNNPAGKGGKVWSFDELSSSGILEVEPLTYIRGRSLPSVYMIVDEAQNLTPLEVKTVLTRVGHGTKIILTGDPYQIDQPYLDSLNNGLTYVAERFKDQPIAAHMTLTKGERSPLAELAANLL